MGVVYSAQDPAIGRMVAIKSIRLGDLTDESERARLRDRLFREAQSAGILSHPNIVTIYDVSEEKSAEGGKAGDAGMAYVFMELVTGSSLDRLLAKSPPPNRQTLLKMFRETAAALDYAHKKGIVHRDIKPANIMLHEDGTAKITDFGVAKIVSQQMTQAGILMGTPNYMSPEQVQTTEITGRADQFSLAVIVYEILTGQKPFAADNLPSLLFKIVREEPTPPHQLNASIGEAIEIVLRRSLSKSPDARFETCTAFIDALETAMKSSAWVPLTMAADSTSPPPETLAETSGATATEPPPAEAVPAPEPVKTEPASAKPKRLFIGLAALLGLFIIGGGTFYWQKIHHLTPPPPPEAAATITTPPPAPSPVAPGENAAPEKAPSPAAVTEAKSPATASFRLTTNPAGADATFDGDPASRCTTPCTMVMALGRHTVVAQFDGYRDVERIFTLPDEPGLIVNLEVATGTLSVVTNPARLAVLIDGQEQTQKTPASFTLSVGSHKVEVIRGAEKQEFSVDIRDGVLTQKRITWN